jgi:hypothetical protein
LVDRRFANRDRRFVNGSSSLESSRNIGAYRAPDVSCTKPSYPLIEALRTRHNWISFPRSHSRHGETQLFPPLNRPNATPQIGSDFLPAIQKHCPILYLSGTARISRNRGLAQFFAKGLIVIIYVLEDEWLVSEDYQHGSGSGAVHACQYYSVGQGPTWFQTLSPATENTFMSFDCSPTRPASPQAAQCCCARHTAQLR